jgi:hypothetical protein
MTEVPETRVLAIASHVSQNTPRYFITDPESRSYTGEISFEIVHKT